MKLGSTNIRGGIADIEARGHHGRTEWLTTRGDPAKKATNQKDGRNCRGGGLSVWVSQTD